MTLVEFCHLDNREDEILVFEGLLSMEHEYLEQIINEVSRILEYELVEAQYRFSYIVFTSITGEFLIPDHYIHSFGG